MSELGSFLFLFLWSVSAFWYICDYLPIYYLIWNLAICVNGVAVVWLLVHMRIFRRGIWKSRKQGDMAVFLFILSVLIPFLGVPIFGLYLALCDWWEWREKINIEEEKRL